MKLAAAGAMNDINMLIGVRYLFNVSAAEVAVSVLLVFKRKTTSGTIMGYLVHTASLSNRMSKFDEAWIIKSPLMMSIGDVNWSTNPLSLIVNIWHLISLQLYSLFLMESLKVISNGSNIRDWRFMGTEKITSA